MKKLNKLLFNGFFGLVWAFSLNAQQAQLDVRMSQTISNGVVTPEEMMVNPACLAKVWATEPLAADFYTEMEVAAQRIINSKVAEFVLTYSPEEIEKEWTSIDFEEITPYTWKWVDFELPRIDGTLTKIALRRPHWWLRDIGADSVGKQVYLNLPELGSQGWATVKAIRVNQLDTRFWDENRQGDFVSRPITGKFEHESSDVYYLYFGENPTPLGVTGSHPIWSIDRNDWIGASDLQIGEKVKTQDGLTVLKTRYKSDEKQKVYNLEIYKDHNFFVSTDRILVHNTCTPKISVVSDDWVTKGAHIHIGPTELAVRPGQNGEIIFQKVFSSTSDADFESAVKVAEQALQNKNWREKFIRSTTSARSYMHNVQGNLSELANGRAAELNFLIKALEQ